MDHDTITEFRRRNIEALSSLFLQVLGICRQAGLVKLGHVALGGTKVRAERRLMCVPHNLVKLFPGGWSLKAA